MRHKAALFAVLVPIGLVMAQDDPFAFMPDGGRESFARVFASADAQAWAVAQALSAEDWAAEVATRAPDLDADQAQTLASYLAVIAPLEVEIDALPAALPPDGRDLALAQCQSCHGLFSGYLMHRRDAAGWLSTFASPFHSGIPMTEAEKAVFADYSAINMPMRLEDVPPELRF